MIENTAAPLTEAQTGLWYAQRLDPSNPIFNTGQYLVLDGALDIDLFRQAADTVALQADALAMRVQETPDDGPVQVPEPAFRPLLQVIDLSGEADPLAAAQQRMQEDMATPLDPSARAMACQQLFVLGALRHVWYLRVHHVAIDGYGMALLEAKVAQWYRWLSAGQGAAPAALPSCAAVLQSDADYRAGERRERDRAWWLEAFAEPGLVASLGEGLPVSGHTFRHVSAALPHACERAVHALADRIDVAWPDVLTGLTAAYLCRHAAAAETVVGVPWMGRMGDASAEIPAMVMNVLPVRIRPDEQAPLSDVMVDVMRSLRQARRHGRYRSEQLRRDLGLLGGQKRLYGPMINVLPFSDAGNWPDGLAATRHVLGTGPVDDLTFSFHADGSGAGLVLDIDAHPDLYDNQVVQAHLARLLCFIEAAAQADTLAQVQTLTPAEQVYWTHTVNDTAHPVPDTTLWALIEAAMLQYPERLALTDAQQTLDYAALDLETQRWAAILRQHGVRRGDIVAVALPRGNDLALALLSSLRAGAAYLPLDIEHPAGRLQTILEAAQPRVVLTTAEVAARLPAVPQQLWVERDCDASRLVLLDDGQAADNAPQADDAAYILYTSGSTGTPKGVVIEHRAIVNRLLWMQQHYGVGMDERILQKTPVTFDVSVWEFFLPLMSGATLVMAPPQAHRDPAWLAALMREQAITTLHFVPSMLAAFLDEPSINGLEPRRIFCSGEALPAALRDRFHQMLPGVELHNLYGPTEAAVDVSWWPASADDRSVPVPIGFPVWNTALYVLDDAMRPCPPGTQGHLYLAGRQLARGYLGRPDLTAERFVADPFRAGERMYATGDLARWRADGAVVFLGRSDHQVKIRGQRIELDEVEAVLARAEGVGQLAVIAHADARGEAWLVAYIVPHDPQQAPATEALRQHLAAFVPDYMIPSVFVMLPVLPVTANGKLDRKALPVPMFSGVAGREAEGATEKRLAALFAEVLGLSQPVGAEQDFFEMGGHSLLAARLVQKVRQAWPHAVGLGLVFEHPTVARMAAWLEVLDRAAEAEGAAAESNMPKAGGEGFGPWLVLAQGAAHPDAAPLYCLHPAGGLSWCYGALGRALDSQRPVHGLQALALDPSQPSPPSMAALAASYVDRIQASHRGGPWHLLGWSVGGIIAQAMAAELQDRGLPVGVVAMLDAYPADCWRAQVEPQENMALKALMHIAGFDLSALQGAPLERDTVIRFLRASGHPLGELDDAQIAGVLRVVDDNNRMVREHHHRHYDGEILYFRAALDHQGLNLHPEQWQPYAGRLDIHDVAALHAHMTGPKALQTILPVLKDRLIGYDSQSG